MSIQREGLIEPIVVCPKKDRYELIVGERRFRAVRDYTEMETIQAQIVIAGDLQARRISAAESLQREDLSAIETIEAVVEIVDADLIEDAELIEDKEYASMGKNPADRVKTLLGKLDSVRSSQERGSSVFSLKKRLEMLKGRLSGRGLFFHRKCMTYCIRKKLQNRFLEKFNDLRSSYSGGWSISLKTLFCSHNIIQFQRARSDQV